MTKKRSVIKRVGGHVVIIFDSSNEMAKAQDILKTVNSPYFGQPLRYDRDGENRLFVSSFSTSTEITTLDHKMIWRTLLDNGFEVTDTRGRCNN